MESSLLDEELRKEFETDWEIDSFNESNTSELSTTYENNVNEPISEEYLPTARHLDILCKSFGHKKFRPMQWKIIHSIISERRDNCAIMATGYGKSLCYQFPAVYMGGLALVISPLISLMKDQVLAMKVSNISACLLGTANKNQKETIDEIFENKYSLIYLTPEFCTGNKEILEKIYSQLSVTLIAIDEAHCVSTWGHDFRRSYRRLGILKDIMPDVPILAVTATATQTVKNDIIKTLKLRNPQVTCSGFDRPNLYLSVHLKTTNILGDLRKVMVRKDGEWKFSGPTIIYCITRKQTEDLSMLLNETGVKCLPYHAGLSINVRNDTHEQFLKDKIDVIVATVAFGMGIDKPDVRNIIHYGASRSLEAYYQEVGRAGRDGLPATCIGFYANRDFETIRFLNQTNSGTGGQVNREKHLENMMEYLTTTKCRRQFILKYFQEEKVTSNARCCDNCSKGQPDNDTYECLDDKGRYDFTTDVETFLKAVDALNSRYGINMYILFLRGSKMNKLASYVKHSLHGSGKDKSEAWWKGIAILVEKEKYLVRVQNPYAKQNFGGSIYKLSKKGEEFLNDSKRKCLVPPIQQLLQCLKTRANVWLSTDSHPQPSTSKTLGEDKDREANLRLYHLLMNKRHELANSHDCMPYAIASNAALMDMAKRKPITIEILRKCQFEGFTEAKIDKFGKELVQTVRSFLNIGADQCNETISIQDILCIHPLKDMKNSSTAHISYSMFKTGLTVEEVAQKRGFAPGTIMTHLTDIMKLGFPIKLIDLGITKEIKNTILDAIKKVDTGLSLITPIKNICPSDITYNQVKAVVTYLQIRQHLRKLNIPYIEFDDTEPTLYIPNEVPPKCEASTSRIDTDLVSSSQPTPTQKLKGLIDAFEELENIPNNTPMKGNEDNSNFSEGFNDDLLSAACDELETSLNEGNRENLANKDPPIQQPHSEKSEESPQFNFSLLDSPERESKSQEKRKIEDSSKPNVSRGRKKLKLPPWLTSHR